MTTKMQFLVSQFAILSNQPNQSVRCTKQIADKKDKCEEEGRRVNRV